jgi:hypothetical protein
VLRLTAFRGDGSWQELRQGLGQASREPAHLHRLLARRVEELRPELGFERLVLAAEVTEALAPRQAGLPGEDTAPEELAALLDRLGQRVKLWRLAPHASHWPERAVRRVSPFAAPASFTARAAPGAAAAAAAGAGGRGPAARRAPFPAAPGPPGASHHCAPWGRSGWSRNGGTATAPARATTICRGDRGRRALVGLPQRRAGRAGQPLVPAWVYGVEVFDALKCRAPPPAAWLRNAEAFRHAYSARILGG